MSAPPEAPRVVAAVCRQMVRRVREILPECEPHFVHTGAQLVRALRDAPCEMLIVGLHFDESSAVPALERLLSWDEPFPVVCVRGLPFSGLGQPTLEASRMALWELGAHNFIDLLEYPDDPAGNARVRAMLKRLLR